MPLVELSPLSGGCWGSGAGVRDGGLLLLPCPRCSEIGPAFFARDEVRAVCGGRPRRRIPGQVGVVLLCADGEGAKRAGWQAMAVGGRGGLQVLGAAGVAGSRS